jgi:antitoxin MazE
MTGTISRWGNSLALRIPKAAIEAAGLREGDQVTITEDSGMLHIARNGAVDVAALIAAITPETLHVDDAWLDEPATGREVW